VLFEASAATVTTDKTDYAPGETVTITGTGWLPGETVTLNLHRDTNDPPDTELSAVADANGNITNSEYVCQQFDAGITFLLTATGQTSGYTAQTTFTDANITNNVSVSPASATVTAGDSTNYTVTVSFGGNTTPCTAPLSISGLPAGAAGTFAPTSVTGASNDTPKTSTLTITTTGGFTPTPAGTYTFTVTASTGTGCTGSNRTATGQLVVVASTGACASRPNGFTCRAPAGACDVAETCDGVSNDCPTDAFRSSGFVCRTGSGDLCDPDETCTGSSAACPADVVAPNTTVCNAGSGDLCDPDELCTGVANQACPSDTVAPGGTVCNPGSGDLCDPDEV
jgi:hypothetical protein